MDVQPLPADLEAFHQEALDPIPVTFQNHCFHTVSPGDFLEAFQDLRKMDKQQLRSFLLGAELLLFHRSREQLLAEPEDVMGANHVVLVKDMLTVISEPTRIVPSQYPDRDVTYRGILQSNGDVGLNGRKGEDRLNMTVNNHGKVNSSALLPRRSHLRFLRREPERKPCPSLGAVLMVGAVHLPECQ